ALHRRVIVLGGVVAMWVALVCLAAVLGLVSAPVGLALAVVALGVYLFILAEGPRRLRRLPLPPSWNAWLSSAVREEELELVTAIRPLRGRPRDAVMAAGSLVLVVGARVAME